MGQIAFASDRSGVSEIYLVNIDGTRLQQITFIPEGACQPRWSPDGRQLVFVSPCTRDLDTYPGASLFLVDIDSGNLTPLPSSPGGDYDPSWSHDGTRIVFTSLRRNRVPSLYVINLLDNSVTHIGDPEGRFTSDASWSPTEDLIAYVAADSQLYVMKPDGTEPTRLIVGSGEYINSNPIWSPDGTVVLFSRRPVDAVNNVTSLWSVAYSPEGGMANEISNSTLAVDPAYSPDGFWLVFKSWLSGSHDIYMMRANGVDRQVIVSDPAYDYDPVWRP